MDYDNADICRKIQGNLYSGVTIVTDLEIAYHFLFPVLIISSSHRLGQCLYTTHRFLPAHANIIIQTSNKTILFPLCNTSVIYYF